MEAGPDGWAGGRGITKDSFTVGNPNNMKCHRVTGLKAIPMFPAEKSRTAGRPGEQCLMKRHRTRKFKDRLKVRPDGASKGARVEKMMESLGVGQ